MVDMDFSYDILLVHIYYNKFLETRYKGKYTQITIKIILVVYQNIFEIEPPYMYERERMPLLEVVDCFTHGDCTFIRVLGAYRIPHQLPLLVIDKVVL